MICSLAIAAASFGPAQPSAAPFVINEGDRIVWIGSTIVEREQRYGYWETALHAAYPKVNFTLRNLGWSGDTVWGESRAGFDPPAKGFERLVSLTLELKPSVIFVSYGANESFEGEEGMPRFEQGLNKLLDALKPAKARVVLFTPVPFETSAGLNDSTRRNESLQHYTTRIKKVAGERSIRVADLYGALAFFKMKTGVESLTENGIHLGPSGYQHTTESFLSALGVPPLEEAKPPSPNRVFFREADWPKLDPLRKAIVEKNQLFFYRWRPQNETYLFGFRKHEQGKNAKEVAEFDPLVAKAEEGIARLRKELK